MAVPKTAVYNDYPSKPAENEVGATGQISNMQPVPIAETVDKFADGEFGLGILRFDTGHSLASLCWTERVGHIEILARVLVSTK